MICTCGNIYCIFAIYIYPTLTKRHQDFISQDESLFIQSESTSPFVQFVVQTVSYVVIYFCNMEDALKLIMIFETYVAIITLAGV